MVAGGRVKRDASCGVQLQLLVDYLGTTTSHPWILGFVALVGMKAKRITGIVFLWKSLYCP